MQKPHLTSLPLWEVLDDAVGGEEGRAEVRCLLQEHPLESLEETHGHRGSDLAFAVETPSQYCVGQRTGKWMIRKVATIASMHGEEEITVLPRTTWVVVHLLLLLLGAWLYFGGGSESVGSWLARSWTAGAPARRAALLGFGIVTWLRMTLTATYLLQRRFGWDEFWGVVLATVGYQVGFALLGAASSDPLGLLDVVGIGLFAVGGFLNTGSELQRKRFKDAPANRGKLYTGGLFRLARHINYFGDSLWATGWAILTANLWAALIPVVLTAGFVLFFIPSLSKHLRQHYGEQYSAWNARTKAFIPFVY